MFEFVRLNIKTFSSTSIFFSDSNNICKMSYITCITASFLYFDTIFLKHENTLFKPRITLLGPSNRLNNPG